MKNRTKPKRLNPPFFDIWRDSVRVRVRFAPLLSRGRWYDSWVVDYTAHGKRYRVRRRTQRRARAIAESVATKLAVRTEEIAGMEWEHIAFKRGYIILPKAITKKKRRRIIPILPNLAKWLAPFEGLTGRICYRWATPQTVFQAMDRHAARCGIKAGGNRFRNSYISYRVAQTSDPDKVALEAGNSAAVIAEDYLELTTPEEALKWFSIEPSDQHQKQISAYVANLKRPIGK